MKKWKGKKDLRENLRSGIPGMIDDYFNAGQTALALGTSWDEMHRFRLLTKRFRYTLEIFRPAYGPGLEHRIELLRALQTLLGDINDYRVTSGILEQVEGTETVRTQLDEKANRKTVQLRSMWSEQFEAAGQRERWRRYLTQYACRPGRVRQAVKPAAPEVSQTENPPQTA